MSTEHPMDIETAMRIVDMTDGATNGSHAVANEAARVLAARVRELAPAAELVDAAREAERIWREYPNLRIAVAQRHKVMRDAMDRLTRASMTHRGESVRDGVS